jgi:acetyl-CoA carboxylase biotin carboxylase subunit
MLKRVLIANRGEIALRIVRACKAVQVESVAVCSEADVGSMAVRAADHFVCIGPAPSKRSYLNADAIIGAALLTKADAIHPGYGFLAENSEFAAHCEKAGLVFVGPDPQSISLMAEKARARQCAIEAGVPVVPGSEGEATTDKELLARSAETIGYPVMIKAAAGGGGRGMTKVDRPEEFEQQALKAITEARGAFGDGRVYIEKCIENARHVEVQVLCDGKEDYFHLGERDCSVQRRHQKLIEESPSPGLQPALREELCTAALKLCRAVSYRNAGTIEFLVDLAVGRFYFIEMNTRIQVEHPVTEMVSGIDLVAEQLRIAGGQPISFAGSPPVLRGHAIECRINAEDPAQGFMPTPGRIEELILPGGPGIRVDTHCETGTVIPPFYDSMLAKIIAWGATRDAAIDRLACALRATKIKGVTTTIPAALKILEHPEFREGKHHTRWFEQANLQH